MKEKGLAPVFLDSRLEHPAGWICARYKSSVLLLLFSTYPLFNTLDPPLSRIIRFEGSTVFFWFFLSLKCHWENMFGTKFTIIQNVPWKYPVVGLGGRNHKTYAGVIIL